MTAPDWTPWILRFRSDCHGILRNSRNEIVAEIPPGARAFGPLFAAAPAMRDALVKVRAFIEQEREQRSLAYDGPGLDEETGKGADDLRAYVAAPGLLLDGIDAALARAAPPGMPPVTANRRGSS